MHIYRERLFVPPLWWAAGLITMLMFGAIVWTGFDLAITIAIFATLIGLTTAFLLNWGRATIEVTTGEIKAGTASLRLALVGEVRALDEKQTMAMRGQYADPRAFLLIRPYLRRSVYVEVTGSEPAAPYWLVATRHPAELAAAIQRSQPVVSSDGATMA